MSDSGAVLCKSIPDMHLSLSPCMCLFPRDCEVACARSSSFSSSAQKKKKKKSSSASLQETALCNTFAAALMLRLDKKHEMHEEGGREGTGVFLYDIEEATAVR